MNHRLRPSQAAGCALLLGASAALLGPVLATLALGAARSLLAGGSGVVSIAVVVRTVGVCAGIGVLATALAWAPARVISARGRSRFSALCLVPLLMPPYLAYSGYSIVRDPSWLVGDWLESLAARGQSWLTIELGRALAVWGLALWAWPIAALVLAASMDGLNADEALRLDASGWRRTVERVRMNRAGVVLSVAAVGVVALGSAVPLHLAQVETVAIELWRRMNESAPEAWGAIWVAGWPIVVPAALAAAFAPALLRRLVKPDSAAAGTASRRCRAAGWAVWTLAVVVPLLLFISSMRSPHSLAEFWRLSGQGVVNGSVAALATAVVTGVLGLTLSFVMDDPARARSGLAGAILGAWVLVAIVPGVFIGAALARTGTHLPGWLADVLVVDAHVVRFGCVPLIAAAVCSLSDPPELRDLRAVEGAIGLWGWVGACLPRRLPVVAAACAAGLMGFHEIEATTMLIPPGRDNLAQQILGYLHFSRTEEMAGAAVYLLGGGLMVGLGVSVAISGARRGS